MGFSVQGNIISPVQKVICVSEIPNPLYMSEVTMLSTTKGIPMAKYSVGTHAMGFSFLLGEVVEFRFIFGMFFYR